MSENSRPSAGEVRALAHRLMVWAEQLSDQHVTPADYGEQPHDVILGLAEVMRGTRRLRARVFPMASFNDPTWDVMLDLAIRELNGYRTTLDQLALDGELAAATVYDAVEHLRNLGLVTRTADRFDPRVHWLALSERGKHGMVELLHGMAGLVRLQPGAAAA